MLFELAMASAIQMNLDGGISLKKWEECASARSGMACPLPEGAAQFKACLEEAGTLDMDTSMLCEMKAFPDCFPNDAPEDARYQLRLCGARFAVSARWVTEEWIVAVRGKMDKTDLEAFDDTIKPVFDLPYTDISDDPLEASAERQGSWRSVLKFVKMIKNAFDA